MSQMLKMNSRILVKKRATFFGFAAVFAILGAYLLARSYAATSSYVVEAEYGIFDSSVATCGNDPTASGNNCITFQSAAATRTLNCYETPDTPHLCGFPDATNTGIEPGVTLTQVPATGAGSGPGWTSNNGELTICGTSCAGAKASEINGIEVPFNKSANIVASNVTVRNIRIKGQNNRTTPNDFEGIIVAHMAHQVTIDHCDIAGNAAAPLSGATTPYGGTVNRGDAGIMLQFSASGGGSYGVTISNCNIRGFHGHFWNRWEDDGPTQQLSQVRITRNYLHGVECWDYVNNRSCEISIPQSGSQYTDHCNMYGQSNASGLLAGGTQNVFIDNNTFAMDYPPCATAIVSADSDNAQTNNLNWVVHHNLLAYPNADGDLCIAPGRSGAAPQVAGAPSYVAITHNRFSGCMRPIYNGPDLVGTGVGQSPNNIICGNIFDRNIGTYTIAGYSADLHHYLDEVARDRPAVKPCGTLPWTIPNWNGALS